MRVSRTPKAKSYAEEEDVLDCPWCNRTHNGCPSCGAETGCTDHYRPEDYAEVLCFCDCESQEADGVQFLTIGDVERRLEGEDDDGL